MTPKRSVKSHKDYEYVYAYLLPRKTPQSPFYSPITENTEISIEETQTSWL